MKIFILEDDMERIKLFWEYGKAHDLTVVTSVSEAIKHWKPPYDLVLLDHDLGGEHYVDSEKENTGYQFVKYLTSIEYGTYEPPKFIVHSFNYQGALNMTIELRTAGFDAVMQSFGPNLLNYIKEQP